MYYEENFQCNIDINTMDATCVHYKSVIGRGFPSHSHSYYELRYNIKGAYKAEIGDKHIILPEGSLIFIPPLTIHSFFDESHPADVLQVQFIPRMLGVAHLAHSVPILTPYGLLAENGRVPVVNGSLLHGILTSMLAFCPSSELTVENPDGDISIDDFTPPSVCSNVPLFLGLSPACLKMNIYSLAILIAIQLCTVSFNNFWLIF